MMAVIIHLNRVSFLAAREEKQILRFALQKLIGQLRCLEGVAYSAERLVF